jgi:hypothetical protein
VTLTARDEGGNEGRSEPFAFRLPERLFTKPLAKALVEQRRNLALDARVRSQVITAVITHLAAAARGWHFHWSDFELGQSAMRERHRQLISRIADQIPRNPAFP